MFNKCGIKMKKQNKISSTAYRVLLLMELLNNKPYSMNDINDVFSEDPYIARTFSKEVILKYLSTIRLAGYEISKPSPSNNYTYSLKEAPVNILLTTENIKTLAFLENYVSGLYQTKLQKGFEQILNKIIRYFSKEQLNILNNERKMYKENKSQLCSEYINYEALIKKIEQFCIEGQKIQVKYRLPLENQTMQVVLDPLSIKYISKNVWISGYNTIIGEKQMLNLEYIEDIKQLPTKSKPNHVLSPVIFKLKGRLAKGYRPYEGEEISQIDENEGFIQILAYVDDKNQLMQRLLKYGDLCEILYPKYIREKMIKTIKSTLNNYKDV